jgi:hypothetical protein
MTKISLYQKILARMRRSRKSRRGNRIWPPGRAVKTRKQDCGALIIYSVNYRVIVGDGRRHDSFQEMPENKCFPDSSCLLARGNVLLRLHDFTTISPQAGLQAFLCGSYAIAPGKVARFGQNPTPIAGQARGALVRLIRLR